MMRPWILGLCAAFVPVTLTACAADAPANTSSTRVTLTGYVTGYTEDGMILFQPSSGTTYRMRPLWNQNLNTQTSDWVRVYADKNGDVLNVRNLRVLRRGTPMESARQSLQFSLATDKETYRRGETVKFTMTLRNNSPQPQQLTFNSGQTFNITGYSLDSATAPVDTERTIWSWAQGRMFTRAIREVTMQPGETLKFPAEWDQTTVDGETVPRGEYSLFAELTVAKPVETAPTAPGIDTAPITIRLTD